VIGLSFRANLVSASHQISVITKNRILRQGRRIGQMTYIIGQIIVLVRLQLSLNRKFVDESNAIPSVAHLVERSFCPANARAMEISVVIRMVQVCKRRQVHLYLKCVASVSRRLRQNRSDFPSLVGSGRPASVQLERLLGVLVES
jgi:hypothetical protein